MAGASCVVLVVVASLHGLLMAPAVVLGAGAGLMAWVVAVRVVAVGGLGTVMGVLVAFEVVALMEVVALVMVVLAAWEMAVTAAWAKGAWEMVVMGALVTVA